MIQKVFQTIEKNLVTPEERSRMFEEYNQKQKKLELRKEGEEKDRREMAEAMACNLMSLGVLCTDAKPFRYLTS